MPETHTDNPYPVFQKNDKVRVVDHALMRYTLQSFIGEQGIVSETRPNNPMISVVLTTGTSTDVHEIPFYCLIHVEAPEETFTISRRSEGSSVFWDVISKTLTVSSFLETDNAGYSDKLAKQHAQAHCRLLNL